ncbi:ervatamin-B-like [Triticum dicoccoides]|uniref:ervatamin-B-like n=1 Tax=Triticum dicoccoides TaxID=85692 RepID=UPI001890F18C|nr:ervatamin-B-like [Triticum dicoccoides]
MAFMRSSSSSMALALLPLLVAAAFFIPSMASSASGTLDHGLDGEALLMLGRFHGWMAAHGRSYATVEEKLRRFEVYRSNMEFIEAANRDSRMSYSLGETPFTDLTHDEFMAMFSSNSGSNESSWESEETTVITTRAGPVHEGTAAVEEPPRRTNLNLTVVVPPSVDWREKGVVTAAKYQGDSCSSCWAFTSVATMESAHAISTGGSPPVLSEQQLVDCRINGCGNSWMDKAFEWVIQNGGITTEAAYPYTGKVGTCQRAKPVAVRLRGYKKVTPSGNEAALMAAVAQQPVAASFDYSDPCFQHYIGGVYNAGCSRSGVYTKGACGTTQNHALALVGYGTKPDGTKYWIGKNSWTDQWGDKGFVYFLRDSPPLGLCGIAKYPLYPII